MLTLLKIFRILTVIFIVGILSISIMMWLKIYLHFSSTNTATRSYPQRINNASSINITSADTSNVMIVGYIRGGTTFLGDIVGNRKDNFYMYEPLNKLNKFGFFYNNSICYIKDSSCIHGTADETETVKTYLQSVYNCDLKKSWNKINMWMFAKAQGISDWNDMPECATNSKPHCFDTKSCQIRTMWCLQKMAKKCRLAKSRVTKVVRIGMDLAEELLTVIPSLKIIYLIRDPRAIMNSRFQIWKFLREDKEAAAMSLCQKLRLDYVSSKKIASKFPDRVFTLYYEDFVSRPHNLTKEMFKFVGYNFTEEDQVKLNILTGEESINEKFAESEWSTVRSAGSIETARKWRNSISPLVLEKVNNACLSVYSLLNYVHFESLADLWNLEKPSSAFL